MFTGCVDCYILLIATSDDFLKEVLHRKGLLPKGRALPGYLEEWQHLDVTSPAWVIRHDLKNRQLKGERLPHASGVVSVLRPQRRDVLQITYLPVEDAPQEWVLQLAKERWRPPWPESLNPPKKGPDPVISRGTNGTAIVNVPLRGKMQDLYAVVLHLSTGDDFILIFPYGATAPKLK